MQDVRIGIGMRYLLIELATTACFLFGYFSSHGDLLLAIALSLIFWGLLLVTIEDYETQTIPDLFNGIVLCGTLLFLVVTRDFQSSIFGALFGGGFFFAQWLYKRGLFVGSGDIILGAILGLWLGLSHTLIMIALAYIIGAMISIALLLRKKTNLHSSVPFGPFLALGALCSFFGAGDWYLSML
jgi:prepilin signal peptidase PulO-like enzyme (type II secretory pathway)